MSANRLDGWMGLGQAAPVHSRGKAGKPPTAIASWLMMFGLSGLVRGALPPPDAEVPRIGVREFHIHYQVAEPTDVRDVELWYTPDCGNTWLRYESESPQRSSPLSFVAPREGLYGFLVIVRNEAGASSPPPTRQTEPQQWCFVDWTPPLLQFHTVQKDAMFTASRRVLLRWTAYDAHLLDRPIDLYYLLADQPLWIPIEQHLPNSGRYDWRVPDSIGGRMIIKLVVADRGGHVVERFSEPLRIDAATPAASRPAEAIEVPTSSRVMANRSLEITAPNVAPHESVHPKSDREVASSGKPTSVPVHTDRPRASLGQSTPPHSEPFARAEPMRKERITPDRPTTVKAEVVQADEADLSARAKEGPAASQPFIDTARAKKLHEAGTWYRLRGDPVMAALRFREALQADPGFTDALNDLAGVLYLQGNYAESANVFNTLLNQVPNHRGALKGLALALVACREYKSAERFLMQLAALDEGNAEAWLNLGDVSFLQGNRAVARDYWTKASTVDPNAAEVIDLARKRLAAYPVLPLNR